MIQPFVFVGPALAILAWFLAIPVVRTLILSFQDETGSTFVGLTNYIFAFTDRIMLEALPQQPAVDDLRHRTSALAWDC